MASAAAKFLAGTVVIAAVIYQTFLKGLIFDTLGYGRELSPLSSFNVRCEKVENLGLEACEDMWMHEPSGLLYLSCGHSLARTEWFPPYVFSADFVRLLIALILIYIYRSYLIAPSSDRLNASGRSSTDRIAVLDTRASGPVKDRLRWMTAPNFGGNHGDGALDLHGIDIRADTSSPPTLKILIVNHRPAMDPQTGSLLDAKKLGANSTIEIFESVIGETTMKHIKTYVDPAIETPNDLAWVSDESFVFTNDRSGKVGIVGPSFPSIHLVPINETSLIH